ncbi:hypothetical protein KKC83_05985 [Patescibacteria group bacterium]|nr:hypothetical protein [Candidatus Falkowbacteria bacterium]MBU3905970.1 hypothetical protein [Patescibacteria group bacterium]MBU4015634.1 hypothetical protein [Patescibacteria group bacterium]MBU4027064.1 hypothetical protein [Patescibacteria group bacterium]MBU4072766.1 hypothetical protein [Patescibacteria group bacterium]
MAKVIKLFDPIYMRALELASEIHSKLREQIDATKKDKKLAIYYLQGGCITHAYLAINHWLLGDLGAPFIHKRIIQEMGNVALFISVLPEEHRYIKSFFEKSIISFPNIFSTKWGKEKKAILNKMEWDDQTLKKWQDNAKLLNDGFSNAVHAQIETAAFNSDKYTGEYDYRLQWDEFKGGFIRNFDFGHYIVIPAINPLLINKEVLLIEKDDLDKINQIWEKVSKTGLDIFNNLRDSVLNKQQANT